MSSQYVYEPLGPNSIRLLSIVPGFPSETIKCSLDIVDDITNAQVYDAVSGIWGTELSDEPIMCNGQRMAVTKNLIEAMKYLRPLPPWTSVLTWRTDHPLHSSRNVWKNFATNRREEQNRSSSQQRRALWIKAICINQNNKVEKGNQVKLTQKIFANAGVVKIWLGEANDSYSVSSTRLRIVQETNTPLVIRKSSFHFDQYGRMPIVLTFIAQALRNVEAGDDYWTAGRSATDTVYRNRVHGFPDASFEEWKIIRWFFTKMWFQHIWVIQEVVLAQRAVVILGDWHIEWAAVGIAAAWFKGHGFALPTVVKFIGDMKDLLPVSRAATMWELCTTLGKRRPLLQMLRELRGRKATLEVDKVYAAYNLAEETANTKRLDPLIEPTYDKPFEEVYQNLARFLVIDHGNLAVLSHAGGFEGVKSVCASWVPDWSQDKASAELINNDHDDSPYNADNNEYLTIGGSLDPKCLSVKGIKVPSGVIRAYGDKLFSYGFRHTTYKEEHDFIRSSWKLVADWVRKQDSPEIANESLRMYRSENIPRTFISTLTGGFSDIKRPVHEDPSFLDDAAWWLKQEFNDQIPTSGIAPKRSNWTTMWNSSDSGRFHETFARVCLHRRFFVTTENLMGIGPETMKKGDMVVILFGGKVPYVVRQVSQARYLFIGECYVPGLMTGEAVEQWKKSGGKAEFFHLV
ncbi:heterokaryon incompatibility protein-domain-containing protein [Hypoxylon fragiforme]|uniref:heterokaryon incompatibility protein-domain-containing protein n=1 Tax=Hypoxylon fragiforme TaxID=63214 RepID=UPI0020C6C34A|nr:heterokaryon incompatibility protein-domain-containing protein [Hypoxylon fragiforme]KAI2610093.1 heterokaryon incompatibility protein-domain-containing protein [Hypoxylon fragiforme]